MEDKLPNLFSNAAGSLANLYKEIQNINDKAYQQGRIEASQELIHWCEGLQAEGLKYVPIPYFLDMMQRYSNGLKLQEFPESRKRIREN